MSGIKQSEKWFVILSLVFMSLVITNPVQAEQKIYWIKADPNSAVINTTTTVKVMVACALDANLLPTSVNLIQVDENGKQLATLGRLYDDGTHGDGAAGDNIFTNDITINETQPRYFYYKASVAYKGTLKRTQSDILTVIVKSNEEPEQVRSRLSNDLNSGNIAAVKKTFSSEKYNKLIESMNSAELVNLAAWFANAQLIKDDGNIRFYKSQWVDKNGVGHDVEFTMIRNKLGEWKVIW